MKKKTGIVALLLMGIAQTATFGASISQNGNSVTLSFSELSGNDFAIYRSKGRFSEKMFLANVNGKTFTDNNLGGASPYEYYYYVQQGGNVVARLSMDEELFGPNVYFYSPTDNRTELTAEVNRIAADMRFEQFGEGRYGLFFKPGDYRDTERMQVGFYTQVAGLGKLPKDVKTYTFNTPSPLAVDADANDMGTWNEINSTCTFWRSMENLAVMRRDDEALSYEPPFRFMWGVSQAAPLRRVYSNRTTEFDYLAGWASGGFDADCHFDEAAGSFSQQQWYTRNSHMEYGSVGFSDGGWNNAYQGVTFGQYTEMDKHVDNWGEMVEATDQEHTHQWGNVSNVATTPIIREKPFLFLGDDGRYKVFKPALRKDAVGTSWTDTDMGEGEVIDLVDNFYIVKPGTPAATINAQLRAGKHILFTPGIYKVDEPIYVTTPGTIVLGLGYATLIPGQNNSDCALKVADVDGATIAGLLFDTEYSSESLLRVGERTNYRSHAANPTLLADLFFRVGGVYSKPVNVDQVLVIKSNNVIGDHFWIWRADHGEGTGWNQNTSKNGLVVYGDDVTIYGLFNEHFQEYQTLWYGENGRMYFYQCETPYDPQEQLDYLSHVDRASGQQAEGYAAYKVAKGVKHHYAAMLGIYDVFIYTNGAKINIRNSIEIPKGEEDVKVHHACNVCISSLEECGFQYICGDVGASTWYANQTGGAVAKRFQILDIDGTQVTMPDWYNDAVVSPDKEETTGINTTPATDGKANISYNPANSKATISGAGTNYAVAVYNAQGGKVYEGKNVQSVDLSASAAGLYFVQVTPKNGSKTVKKVVKR